MAVSQRRGRPELVRGEGSNRGFSSRGTEVVRLLRRAVSGDLKNKPARPDKSRRSSRPRLRHGEKLVCPGALVGFQDPYLI